MTIITRDGWLERDARQHERQQIIEAEYSCDCGASDIRAEWRVNRYWRGWLVWCEGCGTLLDEVDGEL